MSNCQELSYIDLRSKEVVNLLDGRRLGRICDIVFSAGQGEVLGIVVPYSRRLFGRNQEVFVPWRCIDKIGEDVILVKIFLDGVTRPQNRKGSYFDNNAYRASINNAGDFENAYANAYNNPNAQNVNTNSKNSSNHDDNEDYSNNYNQNKSSSKKFNNNKNNNYNQNSYNQNVNVNSTKAKKEEKPKDPNRPDCDNKCEKCMLFDCAYRWKNNSDDGINSKYADYKY